MSEWQPIATALKDGRLLWLIEDGAPLGLYVHHQYAGCWTDDTRYIAKGYWQELCRDVIGSPTHWMPLPDPPKDTP